jgi:hypothetical protein
MKDSLWDFIDAAKSSFFVVLLTVGLFVCFAGAQSQTSSPPAVTISTAGANPCLNPASTLNGVLTSTSGTSAVQIIALSGSTKIFPCSLNVVGVSGTTPTFSLVYGTSTSCGTGQTVYLGAWTTTANTVYSFVGPLPPTPAGQALCYLDTGTTPIQRVTLSYVQQ